MQRLSTYSGPGWLAARRRGDAITHRARELMSVVRLHRDDRQGRSRRVHSALQSHLVRALTRLSHPSPSRTDLAGCRSLSSVAHWPPPTHPSSHEPFCFPVSPPEYCSATWHCSCHRNHGIDSPRGISAALADPPDQLDWQRSGLSRSHRTPTAVVEPRSEQWLSGLCHTTTYSRATDPALQHRPSDRRPRWWCRGLRHVPR